ncbi:hypothetical protein NPS01_22820 [Nocardioides psychrotolerans]|uniref:DUF4245 domain-containing protein n=1 Tax=Nocardioides psychrotolerans TaxID=1005945 RepID=A0A1I3I3L8_9ACTN|nr:hypothetical protein NPS01_22820 [Nocardioides psychrotolerans]SFI42469.1 hypothetical protein SAMN05216561_108102 [Nocardioides psychrotolerans]
MLGVLVGLVLLVAVVAFAVLLPRAHGSVDTDLPRTLPGGLTATDVLDDSQADPAAAQEFADQQRELMASAEDRLEAVYDVPAHARTYQDPERGAQVTVMVVEQAAGPFVPDGPPVDPSLLGNARNQTDLVEVGDGTCSLIWQQPVPAGEPITEPDPQAVKCQVGGEDSTYQLIGVGITAQEAVELLEGLLG